MRKISILSSFSDVLSQSMSKTVLSFLFGIFIYSSCAIAQSKLIFAIDIVRHGDRTPLIDSPEMQKIWPQGLGQLTPTGMQQAHALGKRMREIYVHQYHFLPEHYDTNTMTVRASDMDRTLMTAQSVLFGLYPLGTGPMVNHATKALPKAFQPIPVHTVPREQDSLLVTNYDKTKYRQWLETYVFNDPAWVQKDGELKSHYPAWSKATNVPINNLFELLHVNDRLFIERLYHIPLPEGMTAQDADEILEAGQWALLYIINHPAWAATVGNELAQTIKREVLLATEQERPLKYILFVAHDTTIAAQLKLLGQNLEELPPYAAQLHYEVLDTGASDYKIRVTYDQKLLWIDACGGYNCSLGEFESQLDK